MTWRQYGWTGAVLAVLTALGLYSFPGHTFLFSDTQIYVPLFLHIQHPELLQNELILKGAHLTYTIYDEVTLALGGNVEQTLLLQQFLFRYLGYWGAFWLARAAGLGIGGSILTSALIWLGAFIYGPAVITTEFEPVPRGFAVPLIVAVLGAIAQNYKRTAAVLLAVAFLYHAPAVWPVLAIALLCRQWYLLGATAVAGVLLAVLAHNQAGAVVAQPFFSIIDSSHRAIMQTRAPYNWISLWPARYWLQYLISAPLALLALHRLGSRIPAPVQPYFRYIPILGLLTMPLSWIALEQFGWALFPQMQPMRALLFCHLFCQMLGVMAAAVEIEERRWLQAFGWLFVPLTIALRGDLLLISEGLLARQVVLMAVVFVAVRWPQPRLAIPASLCLALFFGEGLRARAFQNPETPALRELSSWAQANTPIESQFFFPDLGRRIEPGIFRGRAGRTVYVCWKQGGQVNYFPEYARVWWERWTALLAPGHPPLDYNDLRQRGITHLVFTTAQPAEPLTRLYEGPGYRVYSLQPAKAPMAALPAASH